MDLIDRQQAIDVIDKIFPADPMRNDYTQGITCGAALATEYIKQLSSAQQETHDKRTETHACDLISRQAAISAICNACGKIDCDEMDKCEKLQLPPANCSEFPNNSDTISRKWLMECVDEGWIKFDTEKDKNIYVHLVRDIAPSAQPERTCVNCGRTANNGGWYADGRTRCPIEEHYALPKDGYCHLWEKRNVTDDDYPERREE